MILVKVKLADDCSSNISTTCSLAVDSPATGELEIKSDEDWWAVDLEMGKTYRIDLQGLDSSLGTLHDPLISGVYNSSGTLISGTSDDDGGSGLESRVEFTPTSTGTFYISAATVVESGTYTLTVQETELIPTDDDCSSDNSTTCSVTVGSPATGELEIGTDSDWWAVDLEMGKTYRIDLQGLASSLGTLENPEISGVYNSSGTYIFHTYDGDSGSGFESRLEFTPTSTGAYYISASTVEDPGTYTLTVQETDPVTPAEGDDCSSSISTTCSLAVGSPAMGELEIPNDRDWWAVDLETGKTYRIDLQGLDSSLGTLDDPLISGVHNSSGYLISGTSDDDGGSGFESRVEYTATSTGTYYIQVSTHDGQGTYTLTVQDKDLITTTTDEGGVDCSSDTSTTCSVTVGSPATGDISNGGDEDWWAVDLEMGKTYRVDLQGSYSSSGTLVNPELFGIYNSSGTRINGTYNDDRELGLLESRVEYTATSTGAYYISARTVDDPGTYTLTVTDITQ